MSVHTTPIPFFTSKELACRCCGVIKMDNAFAARLSYFRALWGSPLKLNSVCRCPSHNTRVKGHPNSLHLTENAKWKTNGTMAADIDWRGWPKNEKIRLARLAHSIGLRVGLHDAFCHIDLGRSLGISPRPFLYGVWANEFSPDDVL